MRAVVAQEVGEPGDVLTVRRVPVPEPGPGQVLVRVDAAPVHAGDLHVIRGRYGYAPPFPAVPGLECAGTVAALGPGAGAGEDGEDGEDGLRLGQRVTTVGVTGTWQEFVVADAAQVLPVPDSLSVSTAAQLIVSPLTAWLLVTGLGLGPGDWLVQTAANSTVGQLVLDLSRRLGFRTVNVVRRRAAVDRIQALGGTEVVCTEDEDLPGRLAQLTAAHPMTKAIDCVAGRVGADVLRALAPGGELVVYGALSTHRQTDPAMLGIPVPADAIIFGGRSMRGFFLSRWFATTPPQVARRELGEVMTLVEKSAMTLPDGQAIPVERALEAVHLAEAPGHGGKPLLVF